MRNYCILSCLGVGGVDPSLHDLELGFPKVAKTPAVGLGGGSELILVVFIHSFITFYSPWGPHRP
jgi:hypothetical protein